MASFLSTLYFLRIPHQIQKRFEKLFQKYQKSLKYKGLRRFQDGIFFVNSCQERKQVERLAFFRSWRHHFILCTDRRAGGLSRVSKQKRHVMAFLCRDTPQSKEFQKRGYASRVKRLCDWGEVP
jgi:hypothetical protein